MRVHCSYHNCNYNFTCMFSRDMQVNYSVLEVSPDGCAVHVMTTTACNDNHAQISKNLQMASMMIVEYTCYAVLHYMNDKLRFFPFTPNPQVSQARDYEGQLIK